MTPQRRFLVAAAIIMAFLSGLGLGQDVLSSSDRRQLDAYAANATERFGLVDFNPNGELRITCADDGAVEFHGTASTPEGFRDDNVVANLTLTRTTFVEKPEACSALLYLYRPLAAAMLYDESGALLDGATTGQSQGTFIRIYPGQVVKLQLEGSPSSLPPLLSDVLPEDV